MILADTSVWADHLRRGDPQMIHLLRMGQIVMHPSVVAEIVLGALQNRRKRLEEMDAMLTVRVAQLHEVRHMIEAHVLDFRGIGLTDAHLIASCLLTSGALLWTRDKNLRNAAAFLSVDAGLS